MQPVLAQVRAALGQRNGTESVRLWDAHQPLLAGRASAAALRADVEAWRERNRLRDELLKLLQPPEPDAAALAAAWGRLEHAGGHPDVEPHRARVERLVARHAAWSAVKGVPAGATEANDRLLLAAWKEPALAGWPPAEAERPRLDQARRRLELLTRLRKTDRPGAAPSEAGERQLLALARHLPADYAPALPARVKSAERRLTALARLRQALAARPASDVAIAEAWNLLGRRGGDGLTAAAERQRAELAARRLPLLEALRQIPADAPCDQRDKMLLAIWKPELLTDCPDARPWQPQYDEAGRRAKLFRLMEAALKSGDDLKAMELLADPLLASYPVPAAWAGRVRMAKAAAAEAGGILEALRRNDPRHFVKVFRAETLRRFGPLFAPHRETLHRWIAGLLAPDRVGPKPPLYRRPAVLPQPATGGYEFRWGWPDVRFTDRCRLAICPRAPAATESPAEARSLLETVVTRRDYEDAGGRVVLFPDAHWEGAYAVVWAEVDAGFRRYTSAPLVLGSLSSGINGNGR